MSAWDDLELRDFRLLAAIDERGSLTAAGKVCHLSQSAVSHRLARLEAGLGFQLVDRTARRATMTAAARPLLALGEHILRDIQAIQTQMQNPPRRSVSLRLATQCYTAYHWLPPLLHEYKRLHPEGQLRVVPELTYEPVDALRKGKLDMGILWNAEDLDSDGDGTKYQKIVLMQDQLHVVMSTRNPLVHRETLRAQDLLDQTLFVYALPDATLRWLGERLFSTHKGHRAPTIVRVPLTEAMLEFIKSDMGVGLLAPWAILPALESKQVRAVSFQQRGARRKWSLCFRRDHPQRSEMAAFGKVLATQLEVLVQSSNEVARR